MAPKDNHPDRDLPPFRQRRPWLGADLQTIRNFLARPAPQFIDAPPDGRWFPLDDGTGDKLHGWLHEAPGRPLAPLVVIVHGMTGCSESYYVLSSARHLLNHGFAVLRLNLRAAGPTIPHCSEQYLAGRSEDLRSLFRQLGRARPLACMAYSLGANMLLKYLGEEGSRSPLQAAVAVSPPVDLAATTRTFHRRRNAPYIRYLLRLLVRDVFNMREPPSVEHAAALRRVRTVYEFDDTYIASRYGFRSADHYYEAHSALPFLGAIRTPCLVVHADDDPWIPREPLRNFDWKSTPALTPALTERGGHVGFHGAGSETPWHDLVTKHFLQKYI